MRLNPFNPDNIDVGRSGGRGFPGGGGGQVGCGALVIALIGALVFGIDPAQMLGGLQDVQQSTQGNAIESGETEEQICNSNTYSLEACNALSSLNQTWEPVFQQARIPFQQPVLVFYSGGTNSGCGGASSAMGPKGNVWPE